MLWTVCCLLSASANANDSFPLEAPAERPRLVVLTDIGGDPDDQQSMIRLMVYSNEFEIEGLIASASGTPGELAEKTTKPHLIREIVDAYGEVRPNLMLHAQGWPAADDLRERIKSGNSNRGWEAVGQGHDTEGAAWIISVVDRPDPRPVNIAIWGGQTDLAQALWRVRNDRGPDGLAAFSAKLRIHDIDDQDGIAERIWQEFPGLFYVLSKADPGRDKREGAYRGMYLGGNIDLTSRAWIDAHVRVGHGPLGGLYPTQTWTAPNPHSTLKEGDTPSWFYFRSHGLSDPEHPEWGGWGGRFVNVHDQIYRHAADTVDGVTEPRATVWRWREAFQNDFQARMDWCVVPPDAANHAPHAVCNGDSTMSVLRITASPGEEVVLDATGTSDPDGDELTWNWWWYREASTYDGKRLRIENSHAQKARVRVPDDAAGNSLHVILEVTDKGTPPLTSYRRAVIQCAPPAE